MVTCEVQRAISRDKQQTSVELVFLQTFDKGKAIQAEKKSLILQEKGNWEVETVFSARLDYQTMGKIKLGQQSIAVLVV